MAPKLHGTASRHLPEHIGTSSFNDTYLANKVGEIVNSQCQAEGRSPIATRNGVKLDLYASYELIACVQKLGFGVSCGDQHTDE
ncbi:hypothetical protein PEX1_098220 [Penicillium expansum]|uniref:Uncharacterized protein n=1 Tax=Penicillium expansum TaxID=27334 RepID=A0A0A2JNP9_PENEN|nr:hypothetical protein PEX2_003730 [Penicillium expansum]KGO42898.1 hypothetical protein PEXP_026470 [Penicillium expansum]KGO57019.1 hypothetical protein PEX2_003730 [Penicillium expansum]KGO62795.1 hypothetical protein PEX1_098220 [Penicillium expansum]